MDTPSCRYFPPAPGNTSPRSGGPCWYPSTPRVTFECSISGRAWLSLNQLSVNSEPSFLYGYRAWLIISQRWESLCPIGPVSTVSCSYADPWVPSRLAHPSSLTKKVIWVQGKQQRALLHELRRPPKESASSKQGPIKMDVLPKTAPRCLHSRSTRHSENDNDGQLLWNIPHLRKADHRLGHAGKVCVLSLTAPT